MLDLRDLYQEVILDHNRSPHNFNVMADASHQAEGVNPLCGDQIYLYLYVKENKIEKVSFTGKGCAISTASASMMTDFLQGKTLEEAKEIFQQFHQMLTQKEDKETAHLGKLAILAGVKTYPARVKCATLAWHTLDAALNCCNEKISTE